MAEVKGRLIIPLDGSEAAEAALAYAEVIPGSDVLLLICLPDQNDLPSLLDQASNEALRARFRESAEDLSGTDGRRISATRPIGPAIGSVG